jgi:hypothetical protein
VQARRVAVDGTTGAFVITVVAIYPLDTPEMSYMLESFAPRPAADDGGMPR